jgi:hypothetical protein
MNEGMDPILDVIVRTLADAPRAKLLLRALDSIQGPAGVPARPIVVVNGDRADPAVLAELARRPGILAHRLQQASAGLARAAGRRLVTAPYFAYLDDDDELIAGSLRAPLAWLAEHPDCDVLVNNGFFVSADGTRKESTHIARHVGDPVASLLTECWLSPGASLFRSAAIGIDVLDSNWSHQEWTHLAFELCARHARVHFMDVATVLYHDTPGSMSKDGQQLESELGLLRLVRRDTRFEPGVRAMAARKYLRTLHNQAISHWRQGRGVRAWQCHLGSMRPPNTLRYLLFSRKLLWPFGRHGA